jgi:hypothetical protein
MTRLKRIIVALVIACACMPAVAQAGPLGDRVTPPLHEHHEHQDYRGADAKDDPVKASEFPDFVPAPRVRVVEVPSPGIDWGDATIGAAGTLVTLLLLTATGMTVVRHRAAT